MGGGIAAAGMTAVDWPVMGTIAASWVISPVMGGFIAAGFLLFIKYAIIFRDDKIEAAVRWIPILVGIMAAAFSVYLAMKGLKNLWKPGPGALAFIGAGFFCGGYAAMRFLGLRNTAEIENRRKAVSHLFRAPLICAAALLSFAHGSNDVANAVGPLAAIVSAVSGGGVDAKVTLPFWVLAIGAVGISIGLMLFGPKIIRIVGEKITKLDPVRAFCVALSASITVIIASTLGLPVSSTHVAVGGVFGVGFLREFVVNRRRPDGAPFELVSDPLGSDDATVNKWAKARKRKLVRRRHLLGIAAAWIVTVPASAVMSAILFFLIRAMM
jgi:PiT family inorganic phosphate transporter